MLTLTLFVQGVSVNNNDEKLEFPPSCFQLEYPPSHGTENIRTFHLNLHKIVSAQLF